jgi:hypothetical protein
VVIADLQVEYNSSRYVPAVRGRKLPSGIHIPQALSVAKHDLTGAGKAKYAITVELRKCS